MSLSSEKALDLVSKLLRLASPGSGTTDSEREVAALELVKLIQDHGLTVTGAGTTPPPTTRSKGPAYNVWTMTVCAFHTGCSLCGRLISPGDIICARVREPGAEVEKRHNTAECRP